MDKITLPPSKITLLRRYCVLAGHSKRLFQFQTFELSDFSVKKELHFNPSTPEFLKWTLPSLVFDTSIVVNERLSPKSMVAWQTVQIQARTHQYFISVLMGPRSRWDSSLWAVSSGPVLFAKVSVLVCRDERINMGVHEETICMKCQNEFSGEYENISTCRPLSFADSMLSLWEKSIWNVYCGITCMQVITRKNTDESRKY